MKISPLLLAGSAAANAGLLALFVAGGPADQASTAVAPRSAPAASNPAAVERETWRDLQATDFPAFADRLRTSGFPPAIVHALVGERIRAQFAIRRAALNREVTARPFWESDTPDAKTAAALAQLAKEERQALEDLLGPAAALDRAALATLRRQFPNFSDEKIALIQRAQQTRGEKAREIVANLPNGMFSAADVAGPEKELRAELAKILTPQELEDYNLRTSDTANNLRRQLAAFDPTEQEFRTLFQLQKAYDDQYQLSGPPGALFGGEQRSLMMQRIEAQKQFTEQIKATLGDQRYVDYQRSIDGNYQQTSQLVARLALPPETTNQVYAVQQDIQQRMTALQSDRTLQPDDRNTQLAALAAKAQTKVTSILGPQGYEAYKQYGGSWLRSLQLPSNAPAGGRGGAGGGRGGGG